MTNPNRLNRRKEVCTICLVLQSTCSTCYTRGGPTLYTQYVIVERWRYMSYLLARSLVEDGAEAYEIKIQQERARKLHDWLEHIKELAETL